MMAFGAGHFRPDAPLAPTQAPRVRVPAAFSGLWTPSRYKAYFGGRGSAKSHSLATALIVQGADQPLRVLCCREIQRSIRDSVKRLLDDKIAACGYGYFYTSTDTEIRGRNGTLFVFAGLRTNPESIKSLEGVDRVWVEEANTVSRRSLDLLIPTVRKDESELWFSWNPRHKTDPVDAMFRGENGPPPGSIVKEAHYSDNPWFPKVLRAEMEYDKRRDIDKYSHVWLGGYQTTGEARVFKNWRIEDFEAPSDARFRFGADWGYANDPTVLVRSFIVGKTLYVDHEAYKIKCEIVDTPALFDTVPEARKWPMRADSARPETISYMQKNGYPRVLSAKKGAGSVLEGIDFLKSYDIVVHPRCKHTIAELSYFSWKTDPLTGEVMPVLEDDNNHVIDALRYSVEADRRAMSDPPVVVPVQAH